jgi:UDP-GlcNAc:undecaprenyl-phosphate GlcNAc-1-phosphate transferase
MNYISLIYGLVAVICAALLAYTVTPPIRVLAYKIGALDIPSDSRRMHNKPIPRLGGLAIFISFVLTVLIFCEPSSTLISICVGGLLLCVLGTLDDIYRLHWLIKLLVQLAASTFAVLNGAVVTFATFGDSIISLGPWSIPLSILWITGLTNAINLIDGLDGLACGVSAICSFSILGVTLLMGDFSAALITAILAGSCVGFLPFNRHPARIFMGDTGALFLGYTLAILSVEGLFKLHTLLSFIIPLSIFALPILDTSWAIFRRILHGKSPFSPDRGHLHHKLIDLGFTQKEAVGIIYAICGLLGLVAITFTDTMFEEMRFIKSILLVAAAIFIFVINFLIMKNPSARYLSGIFDPADIPPEQLSPSKKSDSNETSAKEEVDGEESDTE